MKSYLGKYQGKSMDIEKEKREGWLIHGILVISPDDASTLTTNEQQIVNKIGNKLYGSVLNGKA